MFTSKYDFMIVRYQNWKKVYRFNVTMKNVGEKNHIKKKKAIEQTL